ncbi:fatty-acid-CoA ligase FadD [Mycobacteroides abscessus subsp. massiliense]|uniref:carboxylic acid reductase n=5 Tax=Mycobacteroides abscessus TaxID=36809 RepID=UPI0009A8CD31|nr:carboxylic acid reductase [Mycobacteroides abscessus]SKH36618.1 fatty-acid-CoA ligase FadD [Mycobacteroides abscessus subsp. massiliense]SKI44798.1 fatty-acid-CoA ligase FadD [Mycobacteroides abscessus subsp. massiliense]SKI59262.1 fatty-acid-CoA ligase FadD [Mycobacteroides abscessus subsp. massiliense]SKI68475.1 fatty-acid-CoA ligase FadD [Mycobacteroides abscessus subsp. massiliense]SKJ61143.1 fatty-acid-CoA ligase FadD [Mycobacteroides abscessus subsp. massiliense]
MTVTNETNPQQEQLSRRIESLRESDPQFRAAQPDPAVAEQVLRPGLHLSEAIAALMTGYAERPALGERARELVTDQDGRTTLRLLPRFDTTTYGELWSRTTSVAAAWHHDAAHPVKAGDLVATLGFTSIDYTVLDLAIMILGGVAVPLQTSAPASQWTTILAEAEPNTLAVSIELIGAAMESVRATPSIKQVVVFDYTPEVDDQREAFEAASTQLAGTGIALETLDAVIARGAALPAAPLYAPSAGDDPLALLIYTSGSTGAPKGAMHSENIVRRWWIREDVMAGTENLPMIGLNFMPMSHIMGRGTLTSTLSTGGTGYFAASSDMSTLFEDMELIRPTALALVPRVCDMVFQRFQTEVDRRLASGDTASAEAVAAEVKADIRDNLFGGRVSAVMVGSAPLSEELGEFIESCFELNLTDGYGSTEAGMVFRDGIVQRPPVIDYKLVDVPELGYFSTDKPHPRGELLLKTDGMFLGYYKRPEVTASVFDADGFYMTGDIVAELAHDNIEIIDRRNNVLKLSQGEFVAVATLEAEYANSPVVHQIYVYGSSERSYLLAVVVPTPEAVAAAKGDAAALKTTIADSLQDIAKEIQLQSYEVPRDFIIEPQPFTQGNGLLTGIAKLARPNLKAHYGPRLEQMYAEIAEQQAAELRALHGVDPDKPALETVLKAAQALLGVSSAELAADAHFTDLGGDSLSALSFSDLLRDIFAVEVPVGVIVSAANDLGGVAKFVDEQRHSGGTRPTAETVHGAGHTEIRAADLTLDKFIDEATLHAAPSLPKAAGIPHTVLLTGSNGYLGHYLALEWLERLDKTDGKLIAIIRGKNAEAAYRRLEEAFDTGDTELLAHFRSLADKHLEVLAGDIGDPNLGLDADTWQRLADTVDVIVHPAALVNHVLPYNQLFGPNVVGTAEIIKLAITTKIKPVTYLSTVAVAAYVDPTTFDEESDIRLISAVRPVDELYANGYGNSKWAGEVLLREAHDLCGLPVAVFRSDMILAHSRYTGQLNVPDQFTRLILSLIATGIAPGSFYQAQTTGERPLAHYDGLPGDFTAEAITTLGTQVPEGSEGFVTYDCVNPHADGISLDNFVDWLIEAGYPIARIDNYTEWFTRFDTAIRGLPEKQKQHSLLPLLHAFEQPSAAENHGVVPAKRFQHAVQAAGIGPVGQDGTTDIPHLSRRLIVKYAKDLEQLGLL